MKQLYTLFSFLLVSIISYAQPQNSTTAGTGSNAWPLGASATSSNNKVQWLYQPADFQNGLPAGTITDIYFKTVNPIVSTTFTNLTFKLGTTTINAFTSGPFLPADTVFHRATYRIDNIAAEGWVRIPLDKPFTYNGGENLIVEALHTGYTDPVTIRHTTISTGNRRIYGNHASATGTANPGQMDLGLNMVDLACTTPIGSGIVIRSSNQACSWGQVQFDLQGNSFGIGQTYQWQTSTDNVNWVNASNPSPSTYFVATQSATTYYRAMLRCNTDSLATSSEMITTPAPVSGSYTINHTQITGGNNFQTFAEAINHISCGINGPVVFDVLANTGPYIEQVVFPEIPGTSATNTITVNGNGNTVQFAPPATARHIMQFRGTDYVTINDLIIKTTDDTHGWAVHLTREADHITLKRCMLSVASVTQSEGTLGNSIALVASSSYTLVSQGNNTNFLTVDSCTLEGGYQSIYLAGSTEVKTKHNKFTNNTIRDFYSSGININNQDSAVLAYNSFNRPTRKTNGSILMIDIQPGNTNMLVEANRLHDTHTAATTTTGTATGIGITNCDAPAGSENRIVNNLLYNFNTNGTITGLSNNNSDGVYYYHNTVVLANTTNNNAFVTTRGFYQNNLAQRIHLRNNLIYINRTGAGPKHCLYFNTNTTSFTSDSNILVNASVTPATNGVAFLTSNHPTLAAWKSSNGMAYDQASLDFDPMFVDTAALNFTPTNPQLNDKGAPVGVLTDILRMTRSTTTPDIGAIEWDVPLPVKLVDFAAVRKDMNAQLSWSTVSEENLALFVIERSFDGTSYETIGSTTASGNSNRLQFYSYTDAGALSRSAVIYYRLKMQDADGRYTYSKTAILKSAGKTFTAAVFPNPVIKEGMVKITTSETANVTIKVTTSTGVLTGIVNSRVHPGVNVLTIPASFTISKGIYLVTIHAGENKQVIQLVK